MDELILEVFNNEVGGKWRATIFSVVHEKLLCQKINFFEGLHHYDESKSLINNPEMISNLLKKQLIFYALSKKEIKKFVTHRNRFDSQFRDGKLLRAGEKISRRLHGKQLKTMGIFGELILDLILWLEGKSNLKLRTNLTQANDEEIKGPDSTKISIEEDEIILTFGQAKFGSPAYVRKELIKDLTNMVVGLKINEYYKWMIASADDFNEKEKNKKLDIFLEDLINLSEKIPYREGKYFNPHVLRVFKKNNVRVVFSMVGVFEKKDIYESFSKDKIIKLLKSYDLSFSKKMKEFSLPIPYSIDVHLLMISDDDSIRNEELFKGLKDGEWN